MEDSDTGRHRAVHALIFTAVYSRHMVVWLSFSQTFTDVVAGCEAAWQFSGACSRCWCRQHGAGGDRRRPGQSRVFRRLARLRPGPRVRHRPRPGAITEGRAPRPLGHSRIVLTADTYTSVLPVVARRAAEATARLVLDAARTSLGRPAGDITGHPSDPTGHTTAPSMIGKATPAS